MAVGIECQGNRAVAKHVLNDLCVDAGLQQDARRCVPEVMDPDVPQAGL